MSGKGFNVAGMENKTMLGPDVDNSSSWDSEKGKPLEAKGNFSGDQPEKVTFNNSTSSMANRCLAGLVVLAVIACVVTTILTFVVLSHNTDSTERIPYQKQRIISHKVCVQCIKLFKDPLNMLQPDPLVGELIKRVEDGVQMCCADSDDQLSALLEAILRDQVTETTTTFKTFNSRRRFPPAVAHKQLISHYESKLNSTGAQFRASSVLARFNKDYDDSLTEHVRGVTVLDTALQIVHSGTYYVYLSIHVNPTLHKNPQSLKQWTWRHEVHREHPENLAKTGILLSVAHTKCTDCSQHQETAYLGGTFYLTQGDLITVRLSDRDLVQYNKESSFLGMFLISSSDVL